MGDWNMVLNANDNSHASSRTTRASKQLAFARIIGHLGVDSRSLFPSGILTTVFLEQ
jgi:hypothetical protein